jgi:hypothetical protein
MKQKKDIVADTYRIYFSGSRAKQDHKNYETCNKLEFKTGRL